MLIAKIRGNTGAVLERIPLWFWRDVLLPVVVSRLGLVLVAWLGFHLYQHTIIPRIGAWEISYDGKQKPIGAHVSNAHPFVNMWSRWDTHWYLSIAKRGYEFKSDMPSNAAFFPLYPRLMRVVHKFITFHNDAGWMLAGMIISNVALVAAFCYLFLLIRMDFDQAVAARTILYLSIFPTTLFFSAVYTESLFLFLTVASFYYARKNRWLVASLLGAFAARCRSTGFLLIIPLAYEYLAQRNFRWREIRIDISLLALIPLALFAHIADLRFRYGSWDIIGQAQIHFARGFAWPTTTIWKFLHQWNPLLPLDLSRVDFTFLFCFVALLAYGAFRLRPSYTIYGGVSLFFISTWGFPNSMSRYGLVIFPLFIALALLGRNQYFERVYLVISPMVAAFFMVLFSQWGWVA